jgi:hypothetical protein
LKTRLPPHVFVPLAVFLWGAGAVRFPGGGPAGAVLAWTLIAQFRLWDDLADRHEDRVRDPDRDLVRARSLLPFRLLAAALFVGNAAWLALPTPRPLLLPFLILSGLLLAWYAGLRRLIRGPILRSHLLLLKYPTIAYLVAAPPRLLADAVFLILLALVYLTFCVYEVLHDDRCGAAPGAAGVLGLEMAGMAALAVVLAGNALQAVAAALGAAVLAVLYHRHRRGRLRAPWPYAVFLVVFAWLLSYALAPAAPLWPLDTEGAY